MVRLVVLTFGFLGWTWYELSGGSEFEAGENGVTLVAQVEEEALSPVEADAPQVTLAAADPEPKIEVARADTTGAPLTDVVQPTDRVKTSFVTVNGPVKTIRAPEADVVVTNASLSNDSKPVVTEAVSIDYRVVTGSRVNLRAGPSTSYGVLTQLLRGEEVEILTEDGTGWVELRALDGDNVGWMSADFLTPIN